MSKFVVDLNKTETNQSAAEKDSGANASPNLPTAKKRGRARKIFGALGASLFIVLLVGAIGGYFYWRHLKKTPQYSLALLVDAARRSDQKAIDELVDTDALVDDFMPQITGKAVELYGRNLPPATLSKIEQVAAPILPAVKLRARADIPTLVRDKTRQLEGVPFWAIALGARRYVDIKEDGDHATVAGKSQEQKELNLTMKRNGERWQIVGVKDDELARQVAEKIGQQIIFAAKMGGIKNAGAQLGVENLDNLVKQLDAAFK